MRKAKNVNNSGSCLVAVYTNWNVLCWCFLFAGRIYRLCHTTRIYCFCWI